MGRNFQNRFCSKESAIHRAEQLEAKTGKPHFVKTDALGYYYPAIDTMRLTQIRLIQAVSKLDAVRAHKISKVNHDTAKVKGSAA